MPMLSLAIASFKPGGTRVLNRNAAVHCDGQDLETRRRYLYHLSQIPVIGSTLLCGTQQASKFGER